MTSRVLDFLARAANQGVRADDDAGSAVQNVYRKADDIGLSGYSVDQIMLAHLRAGLSYAELFRAMFA